MSLKTLLIIGAWKTTSKPLNNEERFEGRYGFFRSDAKQVIYRYLDCRVLKTGLQGSDAEIAVTKNVAISARHIGD